MAGGYASLFTGAGGQQSPGDAAAPRQYRILLVDDEPNVLSALKRVFRQEKYLISTAPNGQEALQCLGEESFQLMITDYQMAGMNGAELLRRAKAAHPEMIRIMLTGNADTGAVMGAVNEGAVYKFILKPWDDDDLRITVALALEQYDLIHKNRALSRSNAEQRKEIGVLSKLAGTNRSQLGILLHKRKCLSDRQTQELLRLQQARKEPLIRILLEREWVEEARIRRILREDLLIEEVALAEFQIPSAVAQLLPRAFCERQWVLPLKREDRRLTLVMADPMDMGLIEELGFALGVEIQPVMANVADIQAKIVEIHGSGELVPSFEDLETLFASTDPFEGVELVIEDEDDLSLDELLRGTQEPPAIRLVNAIILEAIRLGVSDIHIQPRAQSVTVRYRIDGVLHDKIHIPHSLQASLVSRIKVMAELDIAERRRPQDGRITVKTSMRMIDLRISTLPTISGEKVVMRILDRNASIQRVEQLGLDDADRDRVLNMISRPQGLVLATGPTGSGKTTTLYSLLQHDASAGKNYVTIEDPVEFYLDMAGQVYVRERIGLTFPSVLRAILRQDPDVILLGEIRDFETAEVAFHAALTGHLVFSTLHTNSAVATVARLLDLGLKPYVVASALEGIIAQRLVRRICDHCRAPVAPDPSLLRKLGPAFTSAPMPTFKGAGCPKCQKSGYRGRLPLFEVLVADDGLRELIAAGSGVLELGRFAASRGATSLVQDAARKVAKGLTTLEEVLRVLGVQHSG